MKRLSKLLFIAGISMLIYDAMAHTLDIIIFCYDLKGTWFEAFKLSIWPHHPDYLNRNIFWAVWHWSSISLMATGYRLARAAKTIRICYHSMFGDNRDGECVKVPLACHGKFGI